MPDHPREVDLPLASGWWLQEDTYCCLCSAGLVSLLTAPSSPALRMELAQPQHSSAIALQQASEGPVSRQTIIL